MKLFYGEMLLADITTNHSMTIDEALECAGINMDEVAQKNGWDDWDFEELRMEY